VKFFSSFSGMNIWVWACEIWCRDRSENVWELCMNCYLYVYTGIVLSGTLRLCRTNLA
jgi:hypothetical protein